MKKFSVFVLSIILLLGLILPVTPVNAASSPYCDQYKGVKKIWWNGMDLRSGQIGRLIVLKNTPLYKFSGTAKVIARYLKPGEFYRIYAFKPGSLSVGGGLFVDRDYVKYETPSKNKIDAVKCINGTYLESPPVVVVPTPTPKEPKYPVDIKTPELKDLYDKVMNLNTKVSSGKYKTYSELFDEYQEIDKIIMSAPYNIPSGSILIPFYNVMDFKYRVRNPKIIVTFSNNEKFILDTFLSTIRFTDNKYYFQFNYLEQIYKILSDSYYINYNSNYPAGILGNIHGNGAVPTQKVFLNPSDINSKYYFEYTFQFKDNKDKKIVSYRDRYSDYLYPPITIEELIDGLGVKAEVTVSDTNIFEIKLLDKLPNK
ncbi:hypothetical protein [Neobacillus sp. PS3-40]|uniref:hypothetical protein n=1 Tax=Neobacillus sp. PS3-40 TaxID=3070679 RepID=UPI0027E09B6F|nr:hypothetical protein [Neobacillus sp. PS3-40]WML44094.1 hypothetical protein RCG20_20310 [Neobacillus sp. PS3-40]